MAPQTIADPTADHEGAAAGRADRTGNAADHVEGCVGRIHAIVLYYSSSAIGPHPEFFILYSDL